MLEQLRVAAAMVPFMQRLTHGEATIGITDLTQYVAYFPSRTLNFGHKPGSPVKEGSGAWAALHSEGVVVKQQPASLYGVPYLAIGQPVRNAEGLLVGAVVCGLPLQLEEDLARMAGDLTDALARFNDAFRGVAEVAEHTAQSAGTLNQASERMGSSLRSTDSAAVAIARVTDQTRLLGMNALIEAAHAGTAGAGFGVVAREIQVLAEKSLRATQEMTKVIEEISVHNGGLMSEAAVLRTDSEALQQEVGQVSALMADLTAMAARLKALADRSGSAS